MAAEMRPAQEKCGKTGFLAVKRMKIATKSVAKKLNRILTKAKTKLKKSTIKEKPISAAAADYKQPACMRSNENFNNTSYTCDSVDLNQTSTSSLHFIESSPFAVDECEWKMVEDSCDCVAHHGSCSDCSDRYSSCDQLHAMLSQSDCDKSSYGSLDDCFTSDTVSLVPLIINRPQSRRPILFRPDFYIQKSSSPPEAASSLGNRHHHTLYQVSDDFCTSSDFENHQNLIERINSRISIDNNGIEPANSNANNAQYQQQLLHMIETFAYPLSYCKKLSTLELSANITSVAQKFLNYVSIIQ